MTDVPYDANDPDNPGPPVVPYDANDPDNTGSYDAPVDDTPGAPPNDGSTVEWHKT